jgi:hypothetical protein
MILDYVEKNSVELLGKSYSRDILKNVLFKSCILESKEPGKYPPTLKLKVHAKRPSGFVAKAFDSNKHEVPLEDVKKGDMIRSVVDINQIWVVDNKFGISVHLKQCRFSPSASLEQCVLDDDDEEDVVEDNEV